MYKNVTTIWLEMHLHGRLLEAVKISTICLHLKFNNYLNAVKTELMRKHQTHLSATTDRPVFILSGIPSCINSFVPLGRS